MFVSSVIDCLECDASAGDLGQDVVGGCGPKHGLGSWLCAARYCSILAVRSGTE